MIAKRVAGNDLLGRFGTSSVWRQFLTLVWVLNMSVCVIADDRNKLEAEVVDIHRRNDLGRYAYVAGEIENPMKIVCEGDGVTVNVEAAVATAGGRSKAASRRELYIVREGRIYKICPKEGGLDKIELQGGDLVFVPPRLVMGR